MIDTTNGSSLKENQALYQKLSAQLAENKGRRQVLVEQVETIESGRGDISSMIEAVVAGGELHADPLTATDLRREIELLTAQQRILDGAIPKLDKIIQSQLGDINREYAKARLPEQQARANRMLDALLDLAEVSGEERTMRKAAEGDGCPGHYFPTFAYVIHGGALTGSFHTEKLHLGALFEKYKAMGFAPTTAHLKRFAALPD